MSRGCGCFGSVRFIARSRQATRDRVPRASLPLPPPTRRFPPLVARCSEGQGRPRRPSLFFFSRPPPSPRCRPLPCVSHRGLGSRLASSNHVAEPLSSAITSRYFALSRVHARVCVRAMHPTRRALGKFGRRELRACTRSDRACVRVGSRVSGICVARALVCCPLVCMCVCVCVRACSRILRLRLGACGQSRAG